VRVLVAEGLLDYFVVESQLLAAVDVSV
jgi:hypothetical protein